MLTKEEEKVNKKKQEEEKFLPLVQTATINYLARFSTKNKKERIKSNNYIYEAKYGQSKIIISFDLNVEDVPDFYVGCMKVQRYIMCKFTEKGFDTNTVTLSVKDMLFTLGLTNNKRSRSAIRQDLKILQNTTVDFTERLKNKTVSGSFNIISGWRWSSGYIEVEIPQLLFDTLNKNGGLMSYPISNFKLRNHSILNFPINDKIAELLTKGNKVISCKKLYECAVSAGLKSYEDISERDERKGFSSAIVKPIEKALDAGKFYTWKYRNSEKHSRFNDWLNDYIEITAVDDNDKTNKGGDLGWGS